MSNWWIVYVNDDPRGAEDLHFMDADLTLYITVVDCNDCY